VKEPPLRPADPTTPAPKRRWAVTRCGFRLFPVRSPLLGESRLLSSPRPTEMFQFGQFPPQALCVQTWVAGHDPGRVSPFGYLRIKALLAAPRSFSSSQGPRPNPPSLFEGQRSGRRGLAPSVPNSVPRRLAVDPLRSVPWYGPYLDGWRSACGIASGSTGASSSSAPPGTFRRCRANRAFANAP